jgi:lipopolysaccharide/colanic/teichoic acid biosynthesis glycosyltransferase
MDLTLVLIFLPVWGPVIILLGLRLIIKLSDGGPIFFWPPRHGTEGEL